MDLPSHWLSVYQRSLSRVSASDKTDFSIIDWTSEQKAPHFRLAKQIKGTSSHFKGWESLNVDKDTQPNTHYHRFSFKCWLFSCYMLTRQASQMQRCPTSWTGLYLPSQTANGTDQSIGENQSTQTIIPPLWRLLYTRTSSSFTDVGRMRQTSHHDCFFYCL